MSRTLSQRGFGQQRTLNGLSNSFENQEAIDDIKDKYDFDATVSQGNLLIGNSVGKYTSTSISSLTEETEIDNDDLFIISNSSGTDVKKMTGTNLATQVLVDLGADNGLSKTGNTMSIANNASVETQTFTLKNSNGNLDLNLDTGNDNTYQPRIIFKNNSVEKSRLGYDKTNNKFFGSTKEGSINLKAFTDTNSGTSHLNLGNGSFNLQCGSASVSLTDIIKGSLTSVNIYKETNLQGNDIVGVDLINGYDPSLPTLNSTTDQVLVKTTVAGAFSTGDLLTVDSNSLLSNITRNTLQGEFFNNIIAGNNLNKTTSNNQLYINLDSDLIFVSSINGFYVNSALLNNNSPQIIVKDTNVNFSNGDILAIDSNSKLTKTTATTILGNLTVSNGLSKSTNNIQIATNPTIETPTFTIKNSTSHIDFNIESGDSVADESRIFFRNSGAERARILYSSNNNKLDCVTEAGAIHIKAYEDTNNGGTSRLLLDNGTFQLQAGSASVSLTDIIRGDLTTVDIYKKLDLRGNILVFKQDDDYQYIRYLGSGMDGLEYHGYGTATSASHRFKAGGSGNIVLEIYPDLVDIFKKVDLNDNILVFKGNDDYQYIRYLGSGMDGLEYHGFGTTTTSAAHRFKAGGSGNIVLEIYPDKAEIKKTLYMNDQRLDLSVGGNADKYYIETNRSNPTFSTEVAGYNNVVFRTTNGGDTERMKIGRTEINMYEPLIMNQQRVDFYNGDANHQITYSGTDTDPVAMNGLIIKAYGNTDAFCRFQSSAGGTFTVMDLFKQKISMYKPLYMNSTTSNNRPIYLHTNTAFYIKYLSDATINGTDIAGYSGVRLSNTNSISSNSVQLQTFGVSPRTLDARGSVEVYNKLSVIRNNATLQQDNNDIFTVRDTGFVKAILHSDNNDVELALKTGGLNGPQAVIKRQTNNRFLINNNGEFKVEVSNNTCTFLNNNGRLAWQSDRNLVIYNTSNNAIWASNTSVSERRFKDDIVSLDLENSYNIIKQLNPVSFVYKEDPKTPKKGFIVDEIEDKIPECIKQINDCECEDMSSKLLFKEDIVPDLVASVKYLISKVETQTTLVSTLQEQLATQATLISNLQSQLDSN